MSLHPPLRWTALGIGMLLVSGCGEPPPEAGEAPASRTDPATTMSAADRADVTASYLCEQGHRIDIIRGNVARLELSDGRVLKLEVIEDSTPRTFTDYGLTFVQQSPDQATLDDEKSHMVTCKATD